MFICEGFFNQFANNNKTISLCPKFCWVWRFSYLSPQTAVFTPAYGSVTNVRINSCMTTPQVLRVLLNKFKIENSPDDFAIYLVHASGGELRTLPFKHYVDVFCDSVPLCWCFRAYEAEAQWLSSGAESNAGSMWAGLQGFPHGGRPGRRSHVWCKSHLL